LAVSANRTSALNLSPVGVLDRITGLPETWNVRNEWLFHEFKLSAQRQPFNSLSDNAGDESWTTT